MAELGFRDDVAGEAVNSDSPLLPDALEKRGVNLETFGLCAV